MVILQKSKGHIENWKKRTETYTTKQELIYLTYDKQFLINKKETNSTIEKQSTQASKLHMQKNKQTEIYETRDMRKSSTSLVI